MLDDIRKSESVISLIYLASIGDKVAQEKLAAMKRTA